MEDVKGDLSSFNLSIFSPEMILIILSVLPCPLFMATVNTFV